MAKFKINNSFLLTGRGEVLAGVIVEGIVSPGDTIHLVLNNNLIKSQIKSIEYVDYIQEKISEVGLIIEPVGSDKYKDQLIGQVITIN
ncbi:MAG TPA: hypothetical protein VK671_05660 [Mucilaginibacter sp.]|jgi:hypothetical protein|nr:hypothetical protein [Mucilaginibacter sp.]